MKFDRWSILAGLRFYLAFIVAVTHLEGNASWPGLSIIAQLGAFEAVLGFLVVSGYSIGCSYAKKPEGFLGRRVARIYPVYLAAIVLVFALDRGPVTASQLGAILVNILFLNQLLVPYSYVGPAWSLSLEFWLYCLAPLSMGMRRPILRTCIFSSLAAYVFYTCGRSLFHFPYYSNLGFGLNLPVLAFAWLAGVQIARFGGVGLKDLGILFSIEIALETFIQLVYRFKHGAAGLFFTDDFTTYLFRATTLLVIWLVFNYVLRVGGSEGKPSKTLRLLGDLSYPLYLIHLPFYALLGRAHVTNAYLQLALALGFSALIYYSLDFYSRRRESRAAQLSV